MCELKYFEERVRKSLIKNSQILNVSTSDITSSSRKQDLFFARLIITNCILKIKADIKIKDKIEIICKVLNREKSMIYYYQNQFNILLAFSTDFKNLKNSFDQKNKKRLKKIWKEKRLKKNIHEHLM